MTCKRLVINRGFRRWKLMRWFVVLASLVLVGIVPAVVSAQDSALLRQWIGRGIEQGLGSASSPERGWSYSGETRMMAWVDVGIARQEFYWKESIALNLWVDPAADGLVVTVKSLEIEDDRIRFSVVAGVPFVTSAQGQVCRWLQTDLDARGRARVDVAGEVAIREGELAEVVFSDLNVGLSALNFEHPCCQLFRGVTQRAANGAIACQSERIRKDLERVLQGKRISELVSR